MRSVTWPLAHVGDAAVEFPHGVGDLAAAVRWEPLSSKHA
jgi:hypothetical protein